MRIEITFKGSVPTLNGGKGKASLMTMHWRQKMKLATKYHLEAMSQSRHRFTGPVTLELVRYRMPGVDNDRDNLYSSLKLPQDAIVKAGILPDDKNRVIVSTTCREVRCKNGEQRTVIILEDVQVGHDQT